MNDANHSEAKSRNNSKKEADQVPAIPKLITQLTRSPRARGILLGVAVLVAASGLSALIFATGPDGAAEQQTEKAWPVTVVRASPTELHPMFATYGRVEARTQAKLRTDIQAEVEAVFVQEGDWANKGDLLIQLRDKEIKLHLREANAEADAKRAALASTRLEHNLLKKSQANYEQMYRASQDKLARQQELAQRRMIPQALLDTAMQQASRDAIEYQNYQRQLADFPSRTAASEAALEKAAAQAERAALDLEKSRIFAPFTGPVLDVHVGPGDRSNAALVLITMADASTFEIRASLPDQYVNRVHNALNNNQAITADFTDSQTTHNLQLSRIAKVVRPGQSGLDAWFRFAADKLNNEQLPALGRVLNLNAVLPTEADVVALPSQALYDNNRIYLVTDNRLQSVLVERIGESRNAAGENQVLVRGTTLLAEHDVMTTALPKAINGLLVTPIRKDSVSPRQSAPAESANEVLVNKPLSQQGAAQQSRA